MIHSFDWSVFFCYNGHYYGDKDMKREKSCGAVIVKKENDRLYTLVIRQNQGHWCFPKGHVKDGEEEEDTARREIKEETGLDVSFIKGFREKTKYNPSEDVKKEVVYFLANPAGGVEKVQEDEVSEMKWAKLVDAIALLTYDNDASLLRKAIRYLKDNDPAMEELF